MPGEESDCSENKDDEIKSHSYQTRRVNTLNVKFNKSLLTEEKRRVEDRRVGLHHDTGFC